MEDKKEKNKKKIVNIDVTDFVDDDFYKKQTEFMKPPQFFRMLYKEFKERDGGK